MKVVVITICSNYEWLKIMKQITNNNHGRTYLPTTKRVFPRHNLYIYPIWIIIQPCNCIHPRIPLNLFQHQFIFYGHRICYIASPSGEHYIPISMLFHLPAMKIPQFCNYWSTCLPNWSFLGYVTNAFKLVYTWFYNDIFPSSSPPSRSLPPPKSEHMIILIMNELELKKWCKKTSLRTTWEWATSDVSICYYFSSLIFLIVCTYLQFQSTIICSLLHISPVVKNIT